LEEASWYDPLRINADLPRLLSLVGKKRPVAAHGPDLPSVGSTSACLAIMTESGEVPGVGRGETAEKL
jgi:hypothetical protein